MKIKYLKNLSFFFSILFLFLLTILFILTLIISYKPIKLNFTDYFDRESKTFKRIDIKEIGDIYISFNKSSKNFELLIEDLLIDETYLPSTLISLDFTFSENIFQTSIKIFDAEITLRDKSNFENVRADEKNLVDLISEKITFIQIFNVIEIINSKILIFADDNVSQKYSVDLNFKNNSAFILLSELFSKNNFVTINLDFSDNFFFNFKSNNFNIDILSFLYPKRLVAFDDLRISGESNLEINRNSKIESFEFDLFLTGSMSYETNFKEKLLIVGDGPEKQKLEELTSRLNLSKNIFFIKHQNKVGEVIKLIDIFCMNSKFEGLGLIMLEAMYFSKPIIAPSISAIPEVVKNEINGLIVKSNDIYAYSNAMLKFISEDYRRQNSMNSKYILNKKFNFNIMIEKTINLYKE